MFSHLSPRCRLLKTPTCKKHTKICILAAALLLFIPFFKCVPASADVIAEPYSNSFYEKHSDECTYQTNRIYIANGPAGKVTYYSNPQKRTEAGFISNGTENDISIIYTDKKGIAWYYLWNLDAWAPADYFTPVYDSDAFCEEFASSIISESGTANELVNYESVLYYSYPGSNVSSSLYINSETPISYNTKFIDEEGHSWIHLGYYYGPHNDWICLDNPTADFSTLYPNGAPARNVNSDAYLYGRTPEPNDIFASDDTIDATDGEGSFFSSASSGLYIIIILIACAVIGTAVLVILILKKNKHIQK